jgi:hypothetical protein
MDLHATDTSDRTDETAERTHAVLAEVTCRWGLADEQATAVIVHAGRGMLVLEATESERQLPPLGTEMRVVSETQELVGRVAEHGRGGRFLVSVGSRPVRRVLRLRVSLPGTLRCAELPQPLAVEIIDLTTGGSRVRGVELGGGTQVALDFTPPGRDEPVTVRAVVAHGTHRAAHPWIGLTFRLVALRGAHVADR